VLADLAALPDELVQALLIDDAGAAGIDERNTILASAARDTAFSSDTVQDPPRAHPCNFNASGSE
jgi:hypothetical protein